MQPRTLALLVLLLGGLSLFLLGIVAAPLLGLIPPRSVAGYPAATIALDLADQVAALQEERAQLLAALSRSLRDIEGFEDRLAAVPTPEASPEDPEARAAQAAEARTALAAAEGRAEAMTLEAASLREQRAALQADLVALADEADALRITLAERDSAIAALMRRAEQADAPPAAAISAAAGGRGTAPDTPDTDSRPPGRPTADSEDEKPADVAAPDARPGAVTDDEAATSDARDLAVADGVAAYRAGDYATAFALWQPLAEAGDARAQFHLGALYYEGRGVARDTATARDWLARAARSGSQDATNLLEFLDNTR